MTQAPYMDPDLPVPDRVEDLLGRMTLDEKLGELSGIWAVQLVEDDRFSPSRAAELLANGAGHVIRVSGSTGLGPRESAAFTNTIQRFCVEETRLGIPTIIEEESTAGFCARAATQFPQAIGLAATWDPELVGEMAAVIRAQMTAVGARQTFAPVLDIARDPRWGRLEETYGEDPYLTARLGVAYVRHLQGGDLRHGVAATLKHFLGYGLSEGGMNLAPAHIGPRELREVFAAPFAAAVREGDAACVMNAYNSIDGVPCGASREILDDLLRGEIGFRGMVTSDAFTTLLLIGHHAVAADQGEAAQRALEAGIDLEIPRSCYADALRERISAGDVPIELVDRSVRRVLALKISLGLFEHPYVDEDAAPAVFDTPDHRTLARRLATESLVLLRNESAEGGRPLLPLDPSLGRVAVLGPTADDVRLLQGDYHYPAHLEISYAEEDRPSLLPTVGGAFAPGPYFVPSTSILDGVKAVVSDGTEVLHTPGVGVSEADPSGIAEAVAAARSADVVILCIGGKSGLGADSTSGEMRDSAGLGLPGVQGRLVEEVVSTDTPTVLAVVGGRAHTLASVVERAPAVLLAWLPGEEGGGAVADVLFGAADPSGRLPVSLLRAPGQIPLHYDHRAGGGRSSAYGDYVDIPSSPLYPFGHGLTYTTFAYTELDITPREPTTDDPMVASCTVTNTGDRAADEVVQLYLCDELARVARPRKALAGFARVHLEPGEDKRITFSVPPERLAYYDDRMDHVVEPGAVRLMIGASSTDIRLERSAVVGGPRRTVERFNAPATTVDVHGAPTEPTAHR